MLVTSDQFRAARALLRLRRPELARRAKVSLPAVRAIEVDSAHLPASVVGSIQRVLEAGGVEFIPGGVRRQPDQERQRPTLDELWMIVQESAALQRTGARWTEHDLYDESGLPA